MQISKIARFPRQIREQLNHRLDCSEKTRLILAWLNSLPEVQAILAEEMPMIYTVSPLCFAAIRDTIGNVKPTVLTPYRVTWNVEELYWAKAAQSR